MIEATVFIGVVVIGLVQFFKYIINKIFKRDVVTQEVTIVLAMVIGALVGLTDQIIGVTDVSIAAGVMIALGAIGATTVASKVGVNTTPAKPTK